MTGERGSVPGESRYSTFYKVAQEIVPEPTMSSKDIGVVDPSSNFVRNCAVLGLLSVPETVDDDLFSGQGSKYFENRIKSEGEEQ